MSIDDRISLARNHRLVEPDVGARWSTMRSRGRSRRGTRNSGATAILEGSGSFVDHDAVAPNGRTQPLLLMCWRDAVPSTAATWFVVADRRGRVDWFFTGDDEMKLHVLVCPGDPRWLTAAAA